MKVLGILLVAVFAISAITAEAKGKGDKGKDKEANFAEHKEKVLEKINNRIEMMEKHRDCAKKAENRDAMKECRKSMRSVNQEMMKEMRKKRGKHKGMKKDKSSDE